MNQPAHLPLTESPEEPAQRWLVNRRVKFLRETALTKLQKIAALAAQIPR